MKRILLALLCSILFVNLFAQIPTIKPTELKYEFISISGGTGLGHDKEQNVYDLVVASDNQFEDKSAIITLGKSSEEIVNSLINLQNTMSSVNMEFDVDGYSFYVPSKGKLLIQNTGKLNYTAGSYILTEYMLESMMKYIIANAGAPVGDKYIVTVNFMGKFSADFDIVFPSYNNKKLTAHLILSNLNNKFASIVKGKAGTVLSKDDILKIADNIANGKVENNREALFFLQIAEALR